MSHSIPVTRAARSQAKPAWPFLATLALPMFALTACGGGGGGDDDDGGGNSGRLRGQLSVLISDDNISEAEPNDSTGQAQNVGAASGGGSTIITGSANSGSDASDFFMFVAGDRLQVNFDLDTADNGADFDIRIWDPVSLQVVEVSETNQADETGNFIAQGTFFVEVFAFSGASNYALAIDADPLPASGAPETEDNDSVPTGNYMGVVGLGNDLRIAGSGGDSDFFHVAVPTNIDLALTLTAAQGGDDFGITVYDSTGGVGSAMNLGTIDTGNNPETGTVTGAAMSLLTFEVFPNGGANGAYTFDIAGISTLTGSSGGNIGRGPGTYRRASLASNSALTPAGKTIAASLEPHAYVAAGDLIVNLTDEARARLSTSALDAAPTRLDEIVRPMEGTVDMTIPGGASLVKFPVPDGADRVEAARYATALAAVLTAHPDVEYAEPNYMRYPTALPQTEVRPNDNFYQFQWHYEQIALPAAWGIQTGSNQVVVAVLDTGSTQNATDMRPQIPGADFDMISNTQIAGDGNGPDTDSTDVGDSNGIQPSSFHGAHVGGTIGAITDNGFGVAGVCWDLQIFHVRCLGIGGGTTFDITQSVLHAAGLNNAVTTGSTTPADIQNLSLGGPGFSQAFQDACTDAYNAGSLVIAAAGNENSSTPSFPAAYDDVISVAAVDFESNRAPYSNFHPTVDIAAPGGDVSVDRNNDGFADGVLSTKPDDTVNPTNFDSFSFYQGTSMASPHVAGVAALVLSENLTLTPAQVENILLTTATDLGAPGRDNVFGEGLVNAFAAVQMAGGGGAGGPQIAVQTGSLLFETTSETRRVGVFNIGSGMLDVTTVTATTDSGGGWLSVAEIAGQPGGPTDVIAVDVTVSAGGLAPGAYTGRVTVPSSNGGTAIISVSLVVGGGGQAQDYEVFIIAVRELDFGMFETVAQDELFTNGSLSYTLPGLDSGDYLIVAGTDEDNDGFICDEGEPLCGAFPSLEAWQFVFNDGDDTISGLDFPLEAPAVSGLTTQGFQLLRTGDDGGNGAEDAQ